MTEYIKIPFNDVFFYGLSLKSRETADVRNDIFANILMRYLRTLSPAHNRLYRVSNGNKYEYNYSFIPSRPLSWRVLKNRRIIEEIEQMSGGKYCLTCYDDQGREVKRVLFNQQHKWLKTNYYSAIAGNNIICSIVPKEDNGQTVILRYDTRKVYPLTMYPCPSASCGEVQERVLRRVPEPDLVALTNYGLLFFASEDTLNIYTQVLKEEEDRYQQENKPPVYTTDEDVASGFCFGKDCFGDTETPVSFDLSQAEELSQENCESLLAESSESESKPAQPESVDIGSEVDNKISGNVIPYLPEDTADAISQAIRLIADRAGIHLDREQILGTAEHTDEDKSDEVELSGESVIQNTSGLFDNTENEQNGSYTIGEGLLFSDALSMTDNNEIDDYVSSLIDSLLLRAKSAAKEYRVGSEENFTSSDDSIAEEIEDAEKFSYEAAAESFVEENIPKSVIESDDSKYMYYGKLDSEGRRTGRGKTLMENGYTAYDGEYLNDKRNGEGSFYYRDGSLCYWGEWKENMRNGFGVGISSESGVKHIGEWRDNKPCGVGIRFDRNGEFLYLDLCCEKPNGGMRVVGVKSDSITVEYWDERTLKTLRKEITTDDLSKLT